MDINLTLPPHAVRYIAELCQMRREQLSKLLSASQYGLGFEAEYDSLNTIESVLPEETGAVTGSDDSRSNDGPGQPRGHRTSRR